MYATAAPNTSALDRFANRSRVASALVFTVGYMIWQPTAQLLLRAFGEPLPFNTLSGWAYFLAVMGSLGAAVGAAWYSVQRLREGWQREWLDSGLRMFAFGSVLLGAKLATEPLSQWLFGTVLASALLGGLWAGGARLAQHLFDSDAAA